MLLPLCNGSLNVAKDLNYISLEYYQLVGELRTVLGTGSSREPLLLGLSSYHAYGTSKSLCRTKRDQLTRRMAHEQEPNSSCDNMKPPAGKHRSQSYHLPKPLLSRSMHNGEYQIIRYVICGSTSTNDGCDWEHPESIFPRWQPSLITLV